MPGEVDLRQMIAEMLMCPPEDVPQDLIHRVFNTRSYCERAGGTLVSRQVVATLVEAWERENGETGY